MKPYQFWQLLGFVFLSHNTPGWVCAILGMASLLISFGVAFFDRPEDKP